MQYEKPETVRRADSVIKGKGSNLIDDPDFKKPEPKPEPVKPKPIEKEKPKVIPAVKENIKPKRRRKGGRRQ